ncbi:MmcQ/YjbR family DNA-binding protein [Frigidibacter sp. MR17.14]|uniref:MmcQ/YjbR family DNA-binding protein n=1 Tax=Frigidibacter sp. MR17.14 TaxID=3126509 RepID=UPI003012E5D1
MSPDLRARTNALCAALPGAVLDHPWDAGHDAWKIGGKMFAVIGAKGSHVSVKTDSVETAAMLIEAGLAERAAYLHRSWVAVPLSADAAELSHRIRQSWRAVRAGLPKRVQATLPDPEA